MAKRPTVYDVAQRAGVSIATVSFAFRRPEKISESTRRSVLAAADELGYVPNVTARGLAHGSTRSIGLFAFDYLLDDDNDDAEQPPLNDRLRARRFPLYVDEVQRGVELECWRRGYALMIGGSGESSSSDVATDLAGRVDALAVFPRTVPAEVLERIARRIPVVEVSEPVTDGCFNHVTVDNAGGCRQITKHLIEAHGCRELRFLAGQDGSEDLARFSGFRSALRKHRLRVPRQPLLCRDGEQAGASALVEKLAVQGMPDAIVCSTDLHALALIDALQAHGIDVPREVAVVGFDGILAGSLAAPALTTVRQPMRQLGRSVVEVLDRRLADPDSPTEHLQLPVSTVIRESCGCHQRP